MELSYLLENNLDRLKSNPYPGRGIICGLSVDGKKCFQVYWIMGRSESSRNRVFEKEGRFVKTELWNKTSVINSELLIYYPVKNVGEFHIVSNGNHTDNIENALKSKESFYIAMEKETYEPDAPHYTPRIAALFNLKKMSLILGIVKKDLFSSSCCRFFYSYQLSLNGCGYCIHTYEGDGNPIPSFSREPYLLPLKNTIEENLSFYWNILNEDNRVSILVKEINILSGSFDIAIINKNQ